MWWEAVTVGVLGGILGLDRRAALQMMFSNPIVAALLVGLWLGHPEIGGLVGAVTALLWLHELPVGAAIPPNDTVIAVVGTFLAVTLTGGGLEASPAVVVALIWAVPFGVLAQRADSAARRLNVAVSRWVVQGPAGAQGRMLVRAHGVSLLTAFAGDVVCTWLALGIGLLLLPALGGSLPVPVKQGLGLVFYLLPLVGVAAGVATVNRRRAWWVVGGIVVMFNLVAYLVER